MLGMLMAVIHANRVISRDFSHNTVSLFYNQQIYSLPVFVASNTMSISQYLVLITTIILLYFFTLKKSKKYSF